MCGIPCFYYSWCKWRQWDGWLPRESEVIIPGELTLEYLGKTVLESGTIARLEFELSGPPHMNLFIQPVGSAKVDNWSFVRKMLDEPEEFQPPYQIFHSYGTDNSSLKFFIDMEKSDGDFNNPTLELAAVGHWVSYEYERDAEAKDFVASFPNFVHVMEWPSIFKRYIF